ncbi:DegT/DnrJ/EryC1/StrS family aminotransferase [uncultured Roseibium sp.]|uniref:DegT/DnrJ/EryC1/StrS family aminotransferase n=1 Tax=uncultured Roseibium sp. TaxID=1936171 RepID=UPI00321693D1
MTPKVPFVDLSAEWEPVRTEALRRIAGVFDHGRFVAGPEVSELEEKLAATVGTKHALCCASGTTALLMAMMALGIGPGDEVIVPAFTFIAPAECALILGASPVLVDVQVPSGLIDPDTLEAAITPRTKAIVAVSLFGLPADFKRINRIAENHGIPVIEDAAQSLGASRNGKASGSLAGIGCTSFFPTKALGGAGDGGAVFTDDADTANRLSEIREHGQSGKYHHVRPGLNGRLGSIAAAALLARLDMFEPLLERRRHIGRTYDRLLGDARRSGLLDFATDEGIEHSARSQYAVVVKARAKVVNSLEAAGVQTAVHYPQALDQQPVLRDCRCSGSLANASTMADKVLCLPIHPALSDDQVSYVADSLCSAVMH